MTEPDAPPPSIPPFAAADNKVLAPTWFFILFITTLLGLGYVMRPFAADIVATFVLVALFHGTYEKILRWMGGRRWAASATTSLWIVLVVAIPVSIVGYSLVIEALAAFNAMRAAEGQALATVIAGQIGRIADLADQARTAADARRPQMEQTLRDNLARVLAGAAEADPARVAQELALLAVKSDVTEELDRLAAHVAAANRLLAEKGAVGRKFDFLMQEFMREANTLCSKSGNAELTRIGLDLKTVIDQMREQVQNVE